MRKAKSKQTLENAIKTWKSGERTGQKGNLANAGQKGTDDGKPDTM